MRDRLDEIVEEVLKRVKQYLAMKRVLLVLRDDSDFMKVKYLTDFLEKEGFTIEICSLLSKEIKVLEWPVFRDKKLIPAGIFRERSYEDFMAGYKGMLISNLSFEEALDYENMRFRESIGRMIFETIKENKPVYALSRQMTGIKNKHLNMRSEKILDELKNMKIYLLTEKESTARIREEGSIRRKEKVELNISGRAYENRMGNPIYHRQFITLADVISYRGQEEIMISGNTRLTMEASDYLSRQGIKVKRLHKRN